MTDALLVRLRAQAEGGGGRMVVVPRADMVELLNRLGATTTTGAVVLTAAPRDVERLARAAWDTATDPSHVDRYGAWHDADDTRRAHHRDAAARTITHLITE